MAVVSLAIVVSKEVDERNEKARHEFLLRQWSCGKTCH